MGLVSTGCQIHVHTRGQIQLQYSSVREVQSPCTERRPRALLHPIRPGSPGQERPSSQLSCTFHIKATMEIGHKNKESDFRTFESGCQTPTMSVTVIYHTVGTLPLLPRKHGSWPLCSLNAVPAVIFADFNFHQDNLPLAWSLYSLSSSVTIVISTFLPTRSLCQASGIFPTAPARILQSEFQASCPPLPATSFPRFMSTLEGTLGGVLSEAA